MLQSRSSLDHICVTALNTHTVSMPLQLHSKDAVPCHASTHHQGGRMDQCCLKLASTASAFKVQKQPVTADHQAQVHVLGDARAADRLSSLAVCCPCVCPAVPCRRVRRGRA